MSPYTKELSLETYPKWVSKIRDHSYHNKLSKRVRETLIRFVDEGVIESTVDCALMRAPSGFVVSYMQLLSDLDITPHDVDNGNLILTNVSAQKLSVIMEDRYRRDKDYVFGWSGKDELSKLGYQSYLSLPLDELIQYSDLASKHRSKIKYSSAKAFWESGKTFKISVRAGDNFYVPQTEEDIDRIENTFEKALERVRRDVPDVVVGNSMGTKNSKFDMYVDEIPNGLINYLKLIGLDSFTVYIDKNRYDLFTVEGSRQLMLDIQELIKYNT